MLCECVCIGEISYEFSLVLLNIFHTHSQNPFHKLLNVIINVVFINFLLNETPWLVAIHISSRNMRALDEILTLFCKIYKIESWHGVAFNSQIKSVIKLNRGSIIDNDVYLRSHGQVVLLA